MASSCCPIRPRSALLGAVLAAVSACGTEPLRGAPDPAPPAVAAAPAAGIELPAGSGREILLATCIDCHDLGGLDLFRNFYAADDWRVLVQTMQGYGAELEPAEVEAVVTYLSLNFAPVGR